MTDLPQLEQLLIDAASRRRRRVRVRRSSVRVLALAAAAALGLLVLPRLLHDVPDREVPAVTPAPLPATIEQAYGVFRRQERPSDAAPNMRKGDVSRLIASTSDVRAYLIRSRGGRLCLATRWVHPSGWSYGCGTFDPTKPPGTFTNAPNGGRAVLAFPDGVHEVTARVQGGAPKRYPVRTNGFVLEVPGWPIELDWMAPSGPGHIGYALPAERAEDYFAVLKRPEVATDALPGLPGARLLADADGARVWLVPRRGAVCLVVATTNAGREDRRSACRRKVADVRYPLVLAVPHLPSHVVAVMFPDGARPLAPRTPFHDGLLLLRDEPSGVRYKDPAGDTRTDTFPPGAAAFELHAEPEAPEAIPAP